MTARRRISTRERAAIFERANGLCHMCGGAIQAGEAWEVSHEIPLAIGGEDGGTNLKPAHKKCHRHHTAAVDAPLIAKVRRVAQAHIGAKRPAGTIRSPGFARRERPEKLPLPPARSLYEDRR